MFKLLRRLFLASVTEDDEEKIRTVRLFNAVSMAALVLIGMMALGVVFIFIRKEAVAASLLLILVFLFISATLARRGRVILASTVLVSALWSIFTVSTWLSGGLNTVLSGSYIVCIVVAGILMGPRAAFFVAGVSTVAGLGFVVLPMLGLNPPQYYPFPPLSAWALLVLNAILMALAMWFGLKDLNEAVIKSRQTAKELETAYEALQEREERYRLHFENINDVVFSFDPELRILDISPSSERIIGYSPEHIVGKPFYELNILHPDYLSKGLEDAKKVLAGGYIQSEVYGFIHRDGIIMFGEVNGSPIWREGKVVGAVSVARDITGRLETERTLQQTERKQQAILENIEEGYYEVDLSGNMVYCNDGMVRMLGYPRDELIGKNNREYMDEETSRKVFHTFNSVFTSGKPVSVTGWTLQRKDGGEKSIEVSVSLLRDSKGEPTGFFGIARDVTERERLHEQRIQAQKMEAIGTLAGGIAHDFNNLLQVINGYAEIALFDLKPGQGGYSDIREIKSAAQSAAELTQGLLTFSRRTESKLRPVDLNQELHNVAKMLTRTLPKIIEIEMSLADELDTITADPTQLQQVVMNLAVNARDAMPDGGKLFIETRNVYLDEEYCKSHLGIKPGKYVLLSVSDGGLGMDDETQRHIFDPFFTTKETGKGTGLGLSVVFGIIKNHGGNITCYSEEGKGTSFKIYLPTIRKTFEEKELDQADADVYGTETILVVDDEDSVRRLGETMLRKFGYTILTASNGLEGLETFRRNKEAISLVILDLIMPEIDGNRCLREILNIAPSMKVLIASGFAANGQIEVALEEGAKASIRKPYEARQMLETVRKVLDGD